MATQLLSTRSEEQKNFEEQMLQPQVCVREKVKIFNFPRMQWDSYPLTSPVTMDKFSRYVWVASELFCSGGGICYLGWPFGRQEAFLLNHGCVWTVTQLPHMLMPRCDQGLWWCPAQQAVLVFGGRH